MNIESDSLDLVLRKLELVGGQPLELLENGLWVEIRRHRSLRGEHFTNISEINGFRTTGLFIERGRR